MVGEQVQGCGRPLRPCFFGWLKQFNHFHPSSTNFNQLQPLLSTTKFHCNYSQPISTYFNQLHPFITPYLPLKETDPKRCWNSKNYNNQLSSIQRSTNSKHNPKLQSNRHTIDTKRAVPNWYLHSSPNSFTRIWIRGEAFGEFEGLGLWVRSVPPPPGLLAHELPLR